MKKIFTILILSSLFAGELEVEGDLTVTGDIDSPTIDALSGMKPDRIYTHISNNDYFSFTVPENKVWYVEISLTGMSNMSRIKINNIQLDLIDGNYRASGNPNFVLQPGYNLENVDWQGYYNKVVLNIFEYSISGSGTDQGMDYVEP